VTENPKTTGRPQLSDDAIRQLQSILISEDIVSHVVEISNLAAGTPKIEKSAKIRKDLRALSKALGDFVEIEKSATPWAGYWVNNMSRNSSDENHRRFSDKQPFQPSEKMFEFMADARALSELLKRALEQFDVSRGRRRNSPAYLVAAAVLHIFRENNLDATLSDNGPYLQTLYVIFDELLPTEKSEAYRRYAESALDRLTT